MFKQITPGRVQGGNGLPHASATERVESSGKRVGENPKRVLPGGRKPLRCYTVQVYQDSFSNVLLVSDVL